jgi:hypothetical protein
MNKIDKKIIGYKVITEDVDVDTKQFQEDLLQSVKEAGAILKGELEPARVTVIKKELKRQLRLANEWRLKPPYAEHALYVRLNAIEYEGRKYPYEIFFNTKDVTQVEWINALTLTLSIAFRTAIETGTSLQPLIDNLKETFGTRGSYLSKVPSKPKFVNGLVAEIGLVLEEFYNECLVWKAHNDNHDVWETDEERQEITAKVNFPCPECGEEQRLLDGCWTCPQGHSKCG